ncbi:Dps family protein [Radiobacillus sp. PE A8.2]|uniref:Dps family protein n=1 Tax=Radiobacillus sp. PE A8.2 TaxID=3380349 RepID=UPI00388D8758
MAKNQEVLHEDSVLAHRQLVKKLNKQLANWNILYTKLHNYHWFVSGSLFFSLHEKFEELYDEAAVNIDEIAERILTIEANPIATLKAYLDAASLNEALGNEKPEDMVRSVTEDFSIMIQEAKETIELAEKNEDDVTADMFTEIKASLEKHNWMLKAYLK